MKNLRIQNLVLLEPHLVKENGRHRETLEHDVRYLVNILHEVALAGAKTGAPNLDMRLTLAIMDVLTSARRAAEEEK